MVIEDTINTAD